jgi:ParB family chromosome partitioning protein
MAKLPPELNATRTDTFLLPPENLTLVTDLSSALYDPRVHDAPDDALVKNIMVYGVLEPVLIRRNGDAVEVVAGRGRVKAALEANKRLAAEGKPPILVPAILRRGQDADLYGVLISENECRRDDSPLLKAGKAQRLLNMGVTPERIAIAFGVSRQTVENWLALEEVATPVRQAVESGKLSASAAVQLSALDQTAQVQTLEKMENEGGKVTAVRARRAARQDVTTATPRMRSRKQIEKALYDYTEQIKVPDFDTYKSTSKDYCSAFCDALRWVLQLDDEQDIVKPSDAGANNKVGNTVEDTLHKKRWPIP